MRYDAVAIREGAGALFDLKGDVSAVSAWAAHALPTFPTVPNTQNTQNDDTLMFIGRNHWLLSAPIEREAELLRALKPHESPVDVSIVRISDTQTFFSVTGTDAVHIMAIASPLDIHDTVFPENGATFSEVFGLKALILRQEGGFLFAVEQSFGNMVEDYLDRAMA